MTTIAVLAAPPRPGSVLTGLADDSPLAAEEAADLYAALLGDACRAVESSGGDLLVNFRSTDDEESDRSAVEAAVAPALDAPSEARYEVQVGSTRSARVGNTVTHLLEREDVRSAAVLDPAVALVERRHVDTAAMKLRQSEAVLGPARAGRVWYAGFTEPVDFADALAPPALATLTDTARSAGADVDFLESLPLVETGDDLASMLVQFRARERAGIPVPPNTKDALSDLDLSVVPDDDGGLTVRRDGATDRS